MKIRFFCLIIFTCILQYTQGQDSTLHKVPKQLSLEAGYRNIFSQSNIPLNNKASHGYGMLFDYAWQLSGLNGKEPAVYLSVPIGYTLLMPDNADSKMTTMLHYGWNVRHNLNYNRPLTPFVGYGLYLNTVRYQGTEGGIMGHQTQFDFGLDYKLKLTYFAKLQYSYTSYPQLNEREKVKYQYVDVRVGVRF